MKLSFNQFLGIILGTAILGATTALLADQYLTYPGERGPKGEQGIAGTAGVAGEQGAPGLTGLSGSIGPQGATGLQGSTGAQGIQGPTGATGPSGTATCPNGPCVSLQAASPGVVETGNINVSGTIIAGTFSGSGSSLTSLNATNLSSGTVADGRLSSNVALLNAANVFTGTNTINKTSTTAFLIQNDSGATNLLTADTTNLKITLGAASATPVLLVLGTKNTTGDPTCTSGAVYYNSNTKQGKVCVDGAWSAVSAPLVTSLPANPSDGDEVTYQADATNGMYWHLRYRAGSASTYKWEVLGGTPLYSETTQAGTTSSQSYTDITGAGPSIALPLAGDYYVDIGFKGDHNHNAWDSAWMSYAIGATGAVDSDATSISTSSSQFERIEVPAYRRRLKTGLPAVTLTAKYRGHAGGTGTWMDRWMSVLPVRVGP